MKNSNLYISGKNSIREIQDNFSHIYPDLSINFFSNRNSEKPDDSCVMYCPDVTIEVLNPGCQSGFIELDKKMTMSELEYLIQSRFGLHAEVGPKSGRSSGSVRQPQRWHLDQEFREGSYPIETGRSPGFRQVSGSANSIY